MSKTILITGSTDGIGKLTAQKLVSEGHRVCLHGRNPNKLAQTINELKSLSKNDQISGYLADLSQFQSIISFSEEVFSTLPKIDVLINNAGVFLTPNPKNENGLDMRFMVNYLAPVLLTNKLLPLLKNGTKPRILNLSSAAQSPVSINALKGTGNLSVNEGYAQSKLAIRMWSVYLAKKEANVAVLSVNPGSLLNTRMVQEAFGHHWSPATKGADILYDLSIVEKAFEMTGLYFDNDKGIFSNTGSETFNKASVEKLINATNEVFTNFI